MDDATAVWPDDRPTVELGTLSITHPVANNDAAQRALAYDPLRLVDGIESSDDPLLEAPFGRLCGIEAPSEIAPAHGVRAERGIPIFGAHPYELEHSR